MAIDLGKRTPADDEPTIGRLVADATKDISTLVNKEIQLAKSELQVSIKNGGIGIGMFAAAGFFAVLMIIMLSITAAAFINWDGNGLAWHWAFLIVTGFWLLVTVIVALIGLKKVKKVKGPERAIAQAQETKGALKRG